MMGIGLIFQVILVCSTSLVLMQEGRADLIIQDREALLDFIRLIPHSKRLNWNESISVCDNWIGVTCNHDNSTLIALRLPGVGLTGTIPPDTLSRLSSLEVLSLRSNNLDGPFPSDILKLVNLTGVFLQSNNFQGSLPSEFPDWENLSVLNLSSNHFNGSIPSSISSDLTHLTVLDLANNALSGNVPDINIHSLQFIDLSNNYLTGILPKSLVRFPSYSFSGNNVSFDTSSTTTANHSKLSEATILGIVIGSIVVAVVLISLLMVAATKRKKSPRKKMITESKDGNTKLTFLDVEAGNPPAFDLEDLLRASAQVLGKGTFGVTYKAKLEDGITVAVKRLSNMSVSKREFEQQMDIVRKMRHENVAPMRAFYYSRDEKVIVYDYYRQGSVSALLHGEVFDVELLKYPNIEEEMVATLQAGLSCVTRVPSQRPRITQVLKMLEELRSCEQTQSMSSRTRSPSLTTTPTRNLGGDDDIAGPSGGHHS